METIADGLSVVGEPLRALGYETVRDPCTRCVIARAFSPENMDGGGIIRSDMSIGRCRRHIPADKVRKVAELVR